MRAWPAVALLALLLQPAAAQETLVDRLREINFDTILVTVHGDKVEVDGKGSIVAGERASELRRCIDKSDCPDDLIAQLSRGNGDGQVSVQEVGGFEAALKAALNLGGDQVQIVRERILTLVQIDGKDAEKVRIEKIGFRDADASVTSTAPIRMDAIAATTFNTGDKGKHKVSMARAETALEISDAFVIRPAPGWSIVKSSIQPADLQKLFNGKEIVGSQTQMEGTEPLAFTIQKDTNWTFWIILSLLALVAAGILLYVLWRRKRAQGSLPPAAPAKA